MGRHVVYSTIQEQIIILLSKQKMTRTELCIAIYGSVDEAYLDSLATNMSKLRHQLFRNHAVAVIAVETLYSLVEINDGNLSTL